VNAVDRQTIIPDLVRGFSTFHWSARWTVAFFGRWICRTPVCTLASNLARLWLGRWLSPASKNRIWIFRVKATAPVDRL